MVGRIEGGRLLLDLRTVPVERDVDRLADMLACGIEPAQLLREARMALAKEGL